MRLGVIGDVHGEHQRLECALRLFDRERVDEVVCVGDVIDGLGDDEACVTRLRAEGVVTVRGNHERWLAEALPILGKSVRLSDASTEWLIELPVTHELSCASALLCHALPHDDMPLLLPNTPDSVARALLQDVRASMLLAGHTHRRMIRMIGNVCVVNAGTLYRKDRAGVVIVDFATRRVHGFDVNEHESREHESVSFVLD